MKIGAYFYPMTSKCAIRNRRTVENNSQIINEISLALNAVSVFEGQKIPHKYCLGDFEYTSWDDEDKNSLKIQVELARKYGLDFFIFDTYMGMRDGKFVQEINKPLDETFLNEDVGLSMEFAVMIIPESPRSVLPVPKGYSEKGREYEYDNPLSSAKEIVDVCYKKYWCRKNYLHINGKPYISVYMSQLTEDKEKRDYIRKLIKCMNGYVKNKYNLELYIVGVASTLDAGRFFQSAGVDALTGYANLPDFTGKKMLQDYGKNLQQQYDLWDQFKKDISIPFVPSAVTGWDATPRCMPGYSLKEVKGLYPFTPIIINGDSEKFRVMLEGAMSFTKKYVPIEQQYGIICAWNEVSESMALLPEICNNRIDFSYLEVVKRISALEH